MQQADEVDQLSHKLVMARGDCQRRCLAVLLLAASAAALW